MFKELFTEAKNSYSIVDSVGPDVYFASTPKEAIEKWVELQKKHPMSISISADSKTMVKSFYLWIQQNTEEFVKIISKQKTYKTDYLYKEVSVKDYTKINFEYDSLHPFGIG